MMCLGRLGRGGLGTLKPIFVIKGLGRGGGEGPLTSKGSKNEASVAFGMVKSAFFFLDDVREGVGMEKPNLRSCSL